MVVLNIQRLTLSQQTGATEEEKSAKMWRKQSIQKRQLWILTSPSGSEIKQWYSIKADCFNVLHLSSGFFK